MRSWLQVQAIVPFGPSQNVAYRALPLPALQGEPEPGNVSLHDHLVVRQVHDENGFFSHLHLGDESEVAAVRAWAHYSAGNLDRVVEECAPFVADAPASGRLPPPLPDLFYFLGRSCLRLGDEARGIRLLERLAADHPCHRACRAFLEEHYRRRDAGESRPPEITAGLEEVLDGQA